MFGKSKKKEREKHNRVRDYWSRRRPHPFFFCFGSHLPVHRLCISFSKFKTKKRGLPNPDRLQLRKFWSLWQSYHTKGRPDLERERECVCVVTCSFVFLCSYNQFVSFSEKKTETKKQKKETERRLPHLGASRRTPRCAHLLLLVLPSCVFPLPPYPCSTFAPCFQQL